MRLLKPERDKMRKMRRVDGKQVFKVEEHFILRNFWEYYVIKDRNNDDDIKLCFVMGIENEMGSVYIPEVKPYIISRTKNLAEVMPPVGFEWVE